VSYSEAEKKKALFLRDRKGDGREEKGKNLTLPASRTEAGGRKCSRGKKRGGIRSFEPAKGIVCVDGRLSLAEKAGEGIMEKRTQESLVSRKGNSEGTKNIFLKGVRGLLGLIGGKLTGRNS